MSDASALQDNDGLLDSVEGAVKAIGAGQAVVVVDDKEGKNDGDLVFAAELATPELTGFVIRNTSGFLCIAMPATELDRLDLPAMTTANENRLATAHAVTVDACDVASTGISARDRAHTIRVLADRRTGPSQLTRPGHVVPLRAVEGGLLRRAGHAEAAVDLVRLSGLRPAGALCKLVNDDGTVMRAADCRRFAVECGLLAISIADLIAYVNRAAAKVERIAEAQIPTMCGEFRAVGYRSQPDGREHLALVAGEMGDGSDVLVHVHFECLTGDVLKSRRCDCGLQLEAAMHAVAAERRGVVLYLGRSEHHAIGLLGKLAAYEREAQGFEADYANHQVGFSAHARDYGIGTQVLADLGVRSFAVVTNIRGDVAQRRGSRSVRPRTLPR